MRWTVLLRLVASLAFGAYSFAAGASVELDFTGTTAHSTIVANGLPLNGSVSFNPGAAVVDYAYSSGGVSTVAYSTPGAAEFSVDGQTYNYNLSDILLNDSGVVLFILTGATDPTNSLFLFRQTSNTDLSVVPSLSTLSGFGVLSAQFPNGSDSVIFADLHVGDSSVPEPNTWAMLLMGSAAIGLSMRRKRMARSQILA